MSLFLQGKRALITGSSHGIGLGVAKQYLHHGARVVLHSHLPVEASDSVVSLLKQYPDSARYLQADFADHDAPVMLVNAAWAIWDGLDVLVNNVGTFREPSLLDITKANFDAIFGLNVWSALAATQAFVRCGKSRGHGGRVLFSSSLNGSRSEPGHTLYDASKGALDALVRQLAIELAPLGYTTAAVAPGLVETPLTDFGLRSSPQERQQILEQIPLRRIATVEDIAEWFVFLASDGARYATGITIPVDGGLAAQQMSQRPVTAAELH
jgi:NAD(P)-dependent dehydrogenase (short-subunit alcohol dehydrogenase family)